MMVKPVRAHPRERLVGHRVPSYKHTLVFAPAIHGHKKAEHIARLFYDAQFFLQRLVSLFGFFFLGLCFGLSLLHALCVDGIKVYRGQHKRWEAAFGY